MAVIRFKLNQSVILSGPDRRLTFSTHGPRLGTGSPGQERIRDTLLSELPILHSFVLRDAAVSLVGNVAQEYADGPAEVGFILAILARTACSFGAVPGNQVAGSKGEPVNCLCTGLLRGAALRLRCARLDHLRWNSGSVRLSVTDRRGSANNGTNTALCSDLETALERVPGLRVVGELGLGQSVAVAETARDIVLSRGSLVGEADTVLAW